MDLSMKTNIYGTLVGLINVSNNEFGANVVNQARDLLVLALQKGDWMRAKLLVRYLFVFFLIKIKLT